MENKTPSLILKFNGEELFFSYKNGKIIRLNNEPSGFVSDRGISGEKRNVRLYSLMRFYMAIYRYELYNECLHINKKELILSKKSKKNFLKYYRKCNSIEKKGLIADIFEVFKLNDKYYLGNPYTGRHGNESFKTEEEALSFRNSITYNS